MNKFFLKYVHTGVSHLLLRTLQKIMLFIIYTLNSYTLEMKFSNAKMLLWIQMWSNLNQLKHNSSVTWELGNALQVHNIAYLSCKNKILTTVHSRLSGVTFLICCLFECFTYQIKGQKMYFKSNIVLFPSKPVKI